MSAITTFAGAPTQSAQLHGFTQSFTYDGVNRLTSVTDSGYGPGLTRQFAYDQYGNMTASEGTAHLDALTPVTGQNAIDPLTNRLRSGNIDAAGNQQAFGSYAVVYDAEDRQSVVADASSGTQYVYEGLGQRVEKKLLNQAQVVQTRTVYVYDAFGQLAAEYGASPATLACTTCYLSRDHLGSVRVVTGPNQQFVSFHDYLPFGEEIYVGNGGRYSIYNQADGVSQRFTGKERDAESGLDYFGARYYDSALGRFTSPDEPLADQDPSNPQSWNLYSYGRNNPLNGIDPNGQNWFSDFGESVLNCFRYFSCHTTEVVAQHRESQFMNSLVHDDGTPLSASQKEDLKSQLFHDLSPKRVIQAVDYAQHRSPDDSAVLPLPSMWA